MIELLRAGPPDPAALGGIAEHHGLESISKAFPG
jgi:hypothetical protein